MGVSSHIMKIMVYTSKEDVPRTGQNNVGRSCSVIWSAVWVVCPAWSSVVEWYNDLVELEISNGTAHWTSLSDMFRENFPAPRASHGFVSVGGNLLVFGGAVPEGPIFDLFFINLENKISADLLSVNQGTVPFARSGHGIAAADNKLYVHGGVNYKEGVLGDFYAFDASTAKWDYLTDKVHGSAPPPRMGHGFAFVDGKIYVHDGLPSTSKFAPDTNVLFMFDPITMFWEDLSGQTSGNFPNPRVGHGFSSIGSILYVHGGLSMQGTMDDMFAFDVYQREWIDLSSLQDASTRPSARYFHGFAAVNNKIYLFGGNTQNEVGSDDFFEYAPGANKWVNFKGIALGQQPTKRFAHGFTGSNGKIYLFGGVSELGILNDLFLFDPTSFTWIKLDNEVFGQPPNSVYNLGFAALKGKLYVHAGQTLAGESQDMSCLTYPQEVLWMPGLRWLVDVYDWDQVVVNSTTLWTFEISLCTRFFPCALTVRGENVSIDGKTTSVLERRARSSLLCHSRLGCFSLHLVSLTIACDSNLAQSSLIQSQGSRLVVTNVSFLGCYAKTDGAIVNAYGLANVRITASLFENATSLGYGGAISSVGSFVDVLNTEFVGCYSERGGGAIWATSYPSCYGTTASLNTTLIIDSCSFTQCKSKTSGGAILASPDSETLGNIQANIFLSRTKFVGCSAAAEGGAVSITDFAELAIVSSVFHHNAAEGLGGGAVHLKNALFLQFRSLFVENSAPNGGGGGIFWESIIAPAQFFGCPLGTTGVISSPASKTGKKDEDTWLACEESHEATATLKTVDSILTGKSKHISEFLWYNPCQNLTTDLSCSELRHSLVKGLNPGLGLKSGSDDSQAHTTKLETRILNHQKELLCTNNAARYGSCVASDYKNVEIQLLFSAGNQVFPGLQFSFLGIKRDTYNQTIVSDSSSLLQAFPALGETDESYSVIGGTLSQLHSGIALFSLAIKPILVEIDFDKDLTVIRSNPELFVKGQDQQTSRGMKSDIFNLNFFNGSQICPAGYVLFLDTPDSTVGLAACKLCPSGTYSVSPLAGYKAPGCFNCPAGGECIGGGANVQFAVGNWSIYKGMFVLLSCPDHYQLINSTDGTSRGKFSHDGQQCKPCDASEYIISSNTGSCQKCPKGARCAFDLSCSLRRLSPPQFSCPDYEQILGNWTVDYAIGKLTLAKCPASHTLISTLEAGSVELQECQGCNQGQYIVSPETQDCLVCPIGALCPDLSCALRNPPTFRCPQGDRIVGEWKVENSTSMYVLFSCPAGHTLISSIEAGSNDLQQCKRCLDGQYIIHPDTDECQSCPKGALCPDLTCALQTSTSLSCPGVGSIIGKWEVSEHIYKLVDCPPGTQLLNSTLGTSSGTFSADIQQCKPCLTGTYIISPNSDHCRPCPLGAECNGLNFIPKVSGSEWIIAGSAYNLVSCPPGYELVPITAQCEYCAAGFFCIGGTSRRAACPDGLYVTAGANSSKSCVSVVFVQVAVSLSITQAEFSVEIQQRFLSALAIACGVSETQAGIQSLSQSRRSTQGLLDVVSKIAASNMAEADSIHADLNQEGLSTQLVKQGLPPAVLKSSSILVPVALNSNESVWVIGVSISAGVCLLMMSLAYMYISLTKKIESMEEHCIRLQVIAIRKRLCILPKDGFVLGAERGPLWSKSDTVIHLRQGHLDAAAHLALMQDFDISQFDAFCLCLERDDVCPFSSQNRYALLQDWLLDICIELIRPELSGVGGHEIISISEQPVGVKQSASERFKYFIKKVVKARIWSDDNQEVLFSKLKLIAQDFMDQISDLCDVRYNMLSNELGGSLLVQFGDVRSAGRRSSARHATILDLSSPQKLITRQDDEEVRAIVVYEEAKTEQEERTRSASTATSSSSSACPGEEVFLSQLHSRATLLDYSFQQRVIKVIQSHETPGQEGRRRAASLESIGESVVEPGSPIRTAPLISRFNLIKSTEGNPARPPAEAFELPSPSATDQAATCSPDLVVIGKGFGASQEMSEADLQRNQSTINASILHWMIPPDRQLSAPSEEVSSDTLQHVRITCAFDHGFGNVDVHTAPIKTISRMREKLLEYAADGAQWPLSANILDPVRASIVCDGAAPILEVVGWFTKHGGEAGLRVCRIKNKFSFRRDELVGGYRDLMICVVFTGVSGLRIIGEIQVQDRKLHDLKQKMHKLYKIHRAANAQSI